MPVDFRAPRCGCCRRTGPAYDKISEESGDTLAMGKVNVDTPQPAREEQIEALSHAGAVPYRDGTAVDSLAAPDSRAMTDRFIKAALENKVEFRWSSIVTELLHGSRLKTF